ncbi:hypothetical protein GCM10023149_41980 [Mucilaginibacter gynuensis]|uniref:DUF3108 domain-containing protein n=1 Tax=Mucilaginibacter gynuensis TaxID=1302236 RepID=A0ABP8H573_9SPHI
MIKKAILFALLLACIGSYTFAQTVDTIRLKDKRLLTSVLQPGFKQYMVYFQMPVRNKVLSISLWTRDVSVTKFQNQPVYKVTQNWYAADTNQYRHIVSINKKADFAPIYHSETIGTKTKAYNWYADKVVGADTVANNLAKDFKIDFNTPNLNWNLDIETFEMLPLAAGKTFAINFYDAGILKPDYILYKVTGSETLTLLNNEKVDCWVLLHDGEHNGAKFTQTFWITKKNHEFIKEEDAFNGGYRYKVKLPGSAVNVVERFKK